MSKDSRQRRRRARSAALRMGAGQTSASYSSQTVLLCIKVGNLFRWNYRKLSSRQQKRGNMTTNGNTRRNAILSYLNRQTAPVNGAELARQFGVSRQSIVQDIALLRAENRNIVSTNKGYVLSHHPAQKISGFTDVITVNHTAEQTLEEMYSIVDYGGAMLDVFIDHDLYSQIRVNLVINDREDAEEFCEKMKKSSPKPLKELTEGSHYHTITAPSKKALQLIREELQAKGILAG